jgi:A118 family predicted phage portal protein
MFKNLIRKIREVLYKLNLIRGIKNVNKAVDIQIDESFYNEIEIWKQLYKGYYPKFHDLTYKTVAGEKKRKRSTMNMPKILSQEMATLVFHEKCDISISDETFGTNVQKVLADNNFEQEFQRYLEYGFALGGTVAKPFFDEGIKIRFVSADCFLPISWDADDINEGVFVNEIRKNNDKYTLLEWHLWNNSKYQIKNELYKSTNSEELGVRVALNTLYPNLQEVVEITGLKRSLFVYFKSNTANNFDLHSPLGISLFANSLDTLRMLDIAFDSFEREFTLGKKRIIVPAYAVKTIVDPNTGQFHRYFDAEDEVYEAMKIEENATSQPIQDISTTLRVEEHIAAINAMLSYLALQVGFTPGTFSFDGTAVKTATEVVSENSKTFRTKQSHETVIEAGIKHLVESIGELAELYNVFFKPEKVEVTVTFDDSIAEDTTAVADRWIKLVAGGLASKKQAIMKVQGVTEEEAIQILKDIGEENKTATAEAVDFFGMNKAGNQ